MTYRILVCDDDREIARAICIYLRSTGYEAVEAHDGTEVLELCRTQTFHLLILDIMMPGLDGIQTTEILRRTHNIPVIMLSAKSEDIDKIDGLTAGADDYMTKPFSMRELIARCKALLRRVDRAKVIAKNSENEKLLDFGSLVIDPAQRIVTVNGKQVHLTPTEFDLLATLARKPKSVLTREKLLEEVWDWVDASGTRTVDSHVKALRHKLGSKTIRTVHGVGYAFEPPELQD